MDEASVWVLVRGSARVKAGTETSTKSRRDAALLRGTAALTLLIAVPLAAPLAVIERAEAACTPATSAASPANNTTVTCTGNTTDQNSANFSGYGTGAETGITINVQTGATVTSNSGLPAAAGIAIHDGTVNNGELASITSARSGIGASESAIINNSGNISGDDRGLLIGGTARVANTGSIIGTIAGVDADAANVTNSGLIEAAGLNSHGILATDTATVSNASTGVIHTTSGTNSIAIGANTVTITGNDGTISATGTNSRATDATGDANVTNGSTGVISTSGNGAATIHAGATATVDNSGTIQALLGGSDAIHADTAIVHNEAGGTIKTIQDSSDAIRADTAATITNSGTIQTQGLSSSAIFSIGSATVQNFVGGLISASTFGVEGQTVTIVGNDGTIEASGANGRAISATDANVTNGGNGTSGTIQALNTNGIAILTSGNATVNNLTGGQITGASEAIKGQTVNVTGNDGTIQATDANGVAIVATGDANVTNGTGTIAGGSAGGAISANDTATVDNSKAPSGLIRAGAFGIEANTVNVTGNVGTIEATAANGIAIVTSGTATVNNFIGGTIAGGAAGIEATTLDIHNLGGTISGGDIGIQGGGSVVNAGTITGGTASIGFTGAGANTLTLQTGSVLNGNAIGSPAAGATNKLVLQGFGSANNNFIGFNSLEMAGGGWTLNGNSAVGTATLNGGSLAVGDGGHTGAVLTGDVTVNSGANLTGLGTVNGNVNVMSGGSLVPGFSLGTFSVSGNVGFASGSTFVVNATPTQASKLAVGGAATLTGGTVAVQASGTAFTPSTQYTILTAAGGLGGTTFSGVTSDFFFLTPSLSYDANDVFLTLQHNNNSFSDAAQTRNQKAVAGALDASPQTSSLVSTLLKQTVEGVRQAFDALSGEIFGSVHNTQAEEGQFARNAVLGRLRQASYAGTPGELGALGFAGPQLAYAGDGGAAGFPVKAPPGASRGSRDLTFWTQGLGGWGRADSDGNAASFSSRFGGFLSGVDARYGTVRAGLMAGYLRSDLNVDARASSAGIDSAQLGAYAGGRIGALNVRGGASYSFDSVDANRTAAFPGFFDQTHARFHGNVAQVFGEVGYGMAFNGVAVEPLAGLAYVNVHDGSFAESGGDAALTGSSTGENIGYSWLGLRLATVVPLANGTVLVPRGSVQWQHAFGDVTPTSGLAFQSTGVGFEIAGVPIARDAALVEGGLDWRVSAQVKLGASYQGELAAHAQTHAVKGAFTWDF